MIPAARSLLLFLLLPLGCHHPFHQSLASDAGAGGVTGTGGATGAGGGSDGAPGSGGASGPELAILAGVPNGQGSADGPALAARFDGPQGIAVDGTGNVFVVDGGNHTVRKIAADGMVTTLAGTAGQAGSADGPGPAARFNKPTGVAVDGAGNVFVADTGNHTIRKITPNGVVSTLAGAAGVSGSVDGASALFGSPQGVAVDGAGNVFVADGDTIRKITPDRAVTTFAGMAGSPGDADGIGSAARFSYAVGIVADRSGNLFVVDSNNGAIRKVTADGVVSTLVETMGPTMTLANGRVVTLASPRALAVDGMGNLSIVYSGLGGSSVRKRTPDGAVSVLAGSAAGALPAPDVGSDNLFAASALAVDAAGNILLSIGDAIEKLAPDGTVSTFAGLTSSFGSTDGTGSAARFANPAGVAVDGAGNVFVADTSNATIRKITPDGVVTTFAGSPMVPFPVSPGAPGPLSYPTGLAVDGAGTLYVSDDDTIRKITPDGVVTTLAGMAGLAGSADGPGPAARFDGPTGVAVDRAGNLYVTDVNNATIRKVTPDGVVATLAGTAHVSGNSDGKGPAARFNLVMASGTVAGVAVDGAGNVFVVDSGNDLIRSITPDGTVTTIAGKAGGGNVDGPLASARFNWPTALALDAAGDLFVADTGNNTVRKITAAGVVSTVVGVVRPPAMPGSPGNAPGPLPASILNPIGVAVDPSGSKLYITLSAAVMVATLE